MFTTLAPNQSCKINIQSMFMKVIRSIVDYLSTVNTNLGLTRCLQHWHLINLVNWLSIPVHESKITLKFLVVGCIKILVWH
jgi:hypothetical protein